MNYKKFFDNLLLEAGVLPSASDSAPDASSSAIDPKANRTHSVPDNAIGPMLDQDTDPDQFLTQGIKDTFDEVRKHFDSKMDDFASTLNPEAAKSATLGQLKEKVKKVYDFTNKIQVFAKAKIEAMAQDPYAIMAAFIASEPTQLAAFQELHKSLEEFQSAFEQIDALLAGVNAKITDFIKDNRKAAEQAPMDQMSGGLGGSNQQQSQPQQPSGMGGGGMF